MSLYPSHWARRPETAPEEYPHAGILNPGQNRIRTRGINGATLWALLALAVYLVGLCLAH